MDKKSAFKILASLVSVGGIICMMFMATADLAANTRHPTLRANNHTTPKLTWERSEQNRKIKHAIYDDELQLLNPPTQISCKRKDRSDDGSSAEDLGCKKRLPRVICIGAQKCGTGALSFFLKSHPSLEYSGEVHYLDKNREKDIEWYRNQMPITSKYQITMDKTPSYLFLENAATKMRQISPYSAMKFIVMLCDPVRRGISHFVHVETLREMKNEPWHCVSYKSNLTRAKCFVNTTFHTSVIKGNGEIYTDNSLIARGVYVEQLEHWFRVFPQKDFYIIDSGEFKTNPVNILRGVETFLGLPRYFSDDKFYFNASRGFYCLAKPNRKCLSDEKGRKHPTVNEDTLQKLREFYRPYNLRLVNLLSRKFSWT